jgi:hypothetical protein
MVGHCVDMPGEDLAFVSFGLQDPLSRGIGVQNLNAD